VWFGYLLLYYNLLLDIKTAWDVIYILQKNSVPKKRTRQLYERLLDRTKHLKVWTSYAEFEASAGLGGEDSEGEEKKNDKEQKMEQVKKCRGK
jgi:hypothetical protein